MTVGVEVAVVTTVEVIIVVGSGEKTFFGFESVCGVIVALSNLAVADRVTSG
jgi:hypothetical protein